MYFFLLGLQILGQKKKKSRKKEVMITIGNAFFHLATNEVYQATKIYHRSLKKKNLISIKSS